MTRTLNSNSNPTTTTKTVKFLYSYGGKILPRYSDGKLRYVGGFTRVLSVDRFISFKGPFIYFVVLSILLFLDFVRDLESFEQLK